jgi:hypothetical protein
MDGELEGSDCDGVAVHLEHCSDCRLRLNELRSLSDVWSSAAPPEPSESEWQRVANRLNRLEDGATRRFRRRTWVAAAIILLLCASAGAAIACFTAEGFWKSFDRARDPVNLIDYLDGANSRQGKTVDPNEICGLVDFKPLHAPDLPGNYKLMNCCVFCDGVVRYKYAHGDSEVIILLYQPGLPVVHGNKPLLTFPMDDGELKIAQCKKRASASWQVDGTAVSIIAPRDFYELADLVHFVDNRLRNGK